MVKTNYANAYKEVLVILDNLIKEDYDKIPKEYIEFLTANCNNDYEFYYDNSKTFEEQELLDDTKYILFGLFEKFGATELQKEKIRSFKNSYYNKLEEEKKEKYNTENLFKSKQFVDKSENINLIVKEDKKETVIIKIFKFIRKIFKKSIK
mgnify:CR=1 FL=1